MTKHHISPPTDTREGPLARVEITMPCPPNRANDERGWQARHGDKTAYFNSCHSYLLAYAPWAKRVLEAPWDRIRWTAHFQVARLYDADNLAALCKWPLDFLVHAGLLTDDAPAHAWPMAWPTQEVSRKHPRDMTLYVEVLALARREVAA